MKNRIKSDDPDIRGSLPALRRAAKRALELAKATGTPCYVMKDGKIINLNPRGTLKPKKTIQAFL